MVGASNTTSRLQNSLPRVVSKAIERWDTLNNVPERSSMATDYWLTAKAAAAHTHTSVPTIYRAARSGRLRAVKVNSARAWRFHIRWVENWLLGESVPGPLSETDYAS